MPHPCRQAALTKRDVSCQHGSNVLHLSAIPAATYLTLPAGGRDTRVLDAALRAVAQSTGSLGQVYDLLPPHVQRASQQLTPSQLRRLPSEFAGTASHNGLTRPPGSISGSSSRPSQSLHVSEHESDNAVLYKPASCRMQATLPSNTSENCTASLNDKKTLQLAAGMCI